MRGDLASPLPLCWIGSSSAPPRELPALGHQGGGLVVSEQLCRGRASQGHRVGFGRRTWRTFGGGATGWTLSHAMPPGHFPGSTGHWSCCEVMGRGSRPCCQQPHTRPRTGLDRVHV